MGPCDRKVIGNYQWQSSPSARGPVLVVDGDLLCLLELAMGGWVVFSKDKCSKGSQAKWRQAVARQRLLSSVDRRKCV